MGLEAATLISQLVATNPVSTDKKNQGDDHLRLLKQVLQATFPNADHVIRFPSILTKNVDYTAVEANDQTTILVDTSAGARIITLPTPANAGWMIRIMKVTTDINPVFILPPSGTINGLFAKMRLNVPNTEMEFFWSGSAFFRKKPAGEILAGSIEWFPGTTAPGYQLANGFSAFVRTDFPELFAAYGTMYGATDGTHFSAPNIMDRFVVAAGISYGLGSTGGEATHILTTAEIPAHTHANTFNDAQHDHAVQGGIRGGQSDGTLDTGGTGAPVNPTAIDVVPAFTGASITNASAGGGGAHENRPPYFALYPMIRLC